MPASPALVASPDWTAISRLMAGCETAGRALLDTDPALGLTSRAVSSGAVSSGAVSSGAVPSGAAVLLLEPAEPLMAADPATGRTYDLQVELLVRVGFGRFPPGATAPEPLTGWSVCAGPAGLELLDGAANVWARPGVAPPARWLSTVDNRGQVLVLYGAWLGVRTPRCVRPAQYGPSQRAAELRDARTRGLVAAATVSWAARPQGGPLPRR